MSDSLFLKVLSPDSGVSDIPRPPVWFMRQAGRALKTYRDLKERYTFIELLRDSELATEVTLLPQKALGIDALILFSDILVIPEALGVAVDYEQGGPKMLSPLKTTGGEFTGSSSPAVLDSVYQTIATIKSRKGKDVDIPLIGFCGGPLTVFLYLYQGSGHGGDFTEALDFFYRHPEKVDGILEAITQVSIDYAQGQVDHGVDAFQIFETWANVIPAKVYVERVLPWVMRLSSEVKKSVPVIYFPRFFSNGYELLLPHLEHFSGIGVDYLMDLETLRDNLSQKLPPEFVLQGNIDPTFVKYTNPNVLSEFLDYYLKFFIKHPRWIVNLGHGVLPGTPESHLKLIVDKVKSFSY